MPSQNATESEQFNAGLCRKGIALVPKSLMFLHIALKSLALNPKYFQITDDDPRQGDELFDYCRFRRFNLVIFFQSIG